MNEINILFKPQAGKLRQIYPELKANKKFEDIPNDELLFVWYYACQSSTIDPELTDMIRATTAASITFKDAPEKKRKFIDLEFSEKIKEAIEEMKKYNPDARMVAKRIIQKTFNNLEKLTNVDDDSFTWLDDEGQKKTDWAGRKAYVDSVAKITETLPGLIAQMEHGFGIVDAKEQTMKKSINTFHENNLD